LDPTSASPRIVEIDGRTGRFVTAVNVPRLDAEGVAPDGRIVAAYVDDDRLYARVIDPLSGRVRDLGPVAKALAISPDGRFYAIGRQDGTVDEYDARSFQLVRHHTLDNAIQTVVFSPDSRELAVEDTSNVVWVWDTCDVCENPTRLAELAARESVRELTPAERATFGVS
jgi:WD40 repeat protein